MLLNLAATVAQLVENSGALSRKARKVSTDETMDQLFSEIVSLLIACPETEAQEFAQELRELYEPLNRSKSRRSKKEVCKHLLDLRSRLQKRIGEAGLSNEQVAEMQIQRQLDNQMFQHQLFQLFCRDGSSAVITQGSTFELAEEDIPAIRETTLRAHHVLVGQAKASSLVSDSKSDSGHNGSDSSSASPVYVQLGPLPDTSLMFGHPNELEMKIADLLGRMPCGYAGAKDVRVHTWTKMPQYVWIEFSNSLDACSFDVSWHSQQPEGFEGVESYHTPQ